MQKYIWLLRHTLFEGDLPTIQFLLEMLEQNPGLPSRTIQMLIRLFLIALIFRLHARGYFQARDAATEVLRREAWDLSWIEWNILLKTHKTKFFIS